MTQDKHKNKKSKKESCLVIQGGSLRGIHSLGMLQVFKEASLDFDCIMGVSAGSLNGLSYVCEELERAIYLMTDLIEDPEYIGNIDTLLKDHSWINFDFMFEGQEGKLEPFDLHKLQKSKTRFICNATRLSNGQVEYFDSQAGDNMRDACIASSTLPLLSAPYELGGQLYLDGGIMDPIPFRKAEAEGYAKILVLCTRPYGYRKKPHRNNLRHYMTFRYKLSYPEFCENLLREPENYNHYIEDLELATLSQAQKFCALYPQEEIKLSVLQHSPQNMQFYLEKGKEEARDLLPQVLDFLEA